jgi:hypothetical protein
MAHGEKQGPESSFMAHMDPIKEPTLQGHTTDFIKNILTVKAITKKVETTPSYKLFHQIIVATIVLTLCIKKEPLIAHLV